MKTYIWNDLHWSKKRGSFIVKNTYVNDRLADDMWPFNKKDGDVERSRWESIETPFKFSELDFEKWV